MNDFYVFLDFYIITVSILTCTATAACGDGALWISFTFKAITFSFFYHIDVFWSMCGGNLSSECLRKRIGDL